jgi:hypothetical protein
MEVCSTSITIVTSSITTTLCHKRASMCLSSNQRSAAAGDASKFTPRARSRAKRRPTSSATTKAAQ